MEISKRLLSVVLLGTLAVATAQVQAQEKIAQTGFQFLSVGTDARATGMGEAFTTVEGSSMALFYNPAGMARIEPFFEFSANRTAWIAGINYFTGSLAISPEKGRYGVVGLSFVFVDYGKIIGTVVAPNEQGFIETGDISPNAFMVGVGYSRALSDRFSVGGQIKYVSQSLGSPLVPTSDSTQAQTSFTQSVIAFDFGTLYKTGFKSLAFGMSIRNFSRQVKFAREDFELPLTFRIGFSIDALDFFGERSDNASLLISFDAANPRSFQEFYSFGGELKLMKALALRAGYVAEQNDYGMTTGLGIQTKKIAFDYSYTPLDVFDDVHRFSVRFSL